MFWLGITVGVIVGMQLGMALTILVYGKKPDTYKYEIEEVWLEGGDHYE